MSSLLVALILLIVGIFEAEAAREQLNIGFYKESCPDAESMVTGVVREAAVSDPSILPVLLRLHFHDCFVQGCDASILIQEDSKSGGAEAERHAFGHQGVGGFDVIDRAKSEVEAACPGIVSCADIVALAARDAVALANGPVYEVPTGRRDGTVSDISLAADMPDVSDSIHQLKAKFQQKGLSPKHLALLTAAHTIGTTACFFMTKRLYHFSAESASDPAIISPAFLSRLKATCPENGDANVRLPIDQGSDRVFDKQIFQNIRNGTAVLESDARLYDDEETKEVVDSYFRPLAPIFGPSFESDFAEAMVRMGQIGVKTGLDGQIRRVCAAFNS